MCVCECVCACECVHVSISSQSSRSCFSLPENYQSCVKILKKVSPVMLTFDPCTNRLLGSCRCKAECTLYIQMILKNPQKSHFTLFPFSLCPSSPPALALLSFPFPLTPPFFSPSDVHLNIPLQCATALFYEVLGFIDPTTRGFPPSCQFLTSCVQILGQVRELCS